MAAARRCRRWATTTPRRAAIAARYRCGRAAPALAGRPPRPRPPPVRAAVADRDACRGRARRARRGHRRALPAGLTEQPAYRALRRRPCPEAEAWAASACRVPCFPELTDDEVDRGRGRRPAGRRTADRDRTRDRRRRHRRDRRSSPATTTTRRSPSMVDDVHAALAALGRRLRGHRRRRRLAATARRACSTRWPSERPGAARRHPRAQPRLRRGADHRLRRRDEGVDLLHRRRRASTTRREAGD